MRPRLLLVSLLALSLTAGHPALAANAAAAPKAAKNDATQNQKTQVEAKIFIWGILVEALASAVFSAFKDWLGKHGYIDATAGTTPGFAPSTSSFTSVENSTTSAPSTTADIKTEITNAAITKVSAVAVEQMTHLLDSLFTSKDAAPVVAVPKAPLSVKGGAPNYQAAHIAIVGADRNGNLTGPRAVSGGFHTGERFKLRVIATFDSVLTINNINPNDERRQIYPAAADAVVNLKAGEETLIPLGKDEFFEFAGATGTEQLVITVVDPRALNGQAAKTKVYRQDETYGSNFAQQVTPDTYPVISQAIALLHQ